MLSANACRSDESFVLRGFEIERCLSESDVSKLVILLGRLDLLKLSNCSQNIWITTYMQI